MGAEPLMFKAVISRDDGEPWGKTGMTSKRWLRQPVRTFEIADLIATQPGVLIHALTEASTVPYGGDPLPHVIEWDGQLYLEDGHHRAVRALLAGSDTITARWLRVGKVRVLRRFGCWHFWCPCCMGGDWFDLIEQAWNAARRHGEAQHGDRATASA